VIFATAAFLVVLMWTDALAGDGYRTQLQPAAFNYTGIYKLRETDPNLTGTGITIAAVCRSLTYMAGEPLNDYQVNIEHRCFWDRDVSFADGLDSEADLSGHSTAIGGILMGQDANGYHPETGDFYYEGAAPAAHVDVYEFWRFVSSYVFGGNELEADVLTMSVGTPFEDWWTRGIERIAEKEGLIVVAGIGNGGGVFDPLLYPAAGGNVIGVGVIDSVNSDETAANLGVFSLPHSEHSSRGPTSNGRCGPDIVAPGNCLVPDVNSTTGYEVSGDWSSFATPVVAGAVSLLVQSAKYEPDLSPAVSGKGSNCVMKAILMNSATKLPYWHKGAVSKADDHQVGLDYIQGAGALNVMRAYEQLLAGRYPTGEAEGIGWDNNVIEKSAEAENVYRIEIPETNGEFITVSLVWNRHFKDSYPFEAKPESDSDLRLELWAVDVNEPARNYLIDYSDSINDNIEHIHCAVDADYSIYEIVVTGGDLTDDAQGTELYGLAWNVSQANNKDSIWWYDLNGDGKVDDSDFTILLNNMYQTAETQTELLLGDINMDGMVNLTDMSILTSRMNSKPK